jgi:mannobiose 2-epimerase
MRNDRGHPARGLDRIDRPTLFDSRVRPVALVRAGGALGLVLLLAACQSPTRPKDLSEHALDFRRQIAGRILPYWYDTARDSTQGGYLLADDVNKRRIATDKQLVTQSRMLWGFSHAHRKGFSDASRNYLTAAEGGYRFLTSHFLDHASGGYYWKTDLAGVPTNTGKFLYGQSYVIYGLVEYFRASGRQDALGQALTLYRDVEKRLHDPTHGGWIEHTDRDWHPLPPGDPRNEVEIVGLKSANAHLHWMEALAELYTATRDPDVGRSLAEAVQINRTWFYPENAGLSCLYRQPDWAPVADPRRTELSYGHNVEFAWLMILAEQALERPPSWYHFYAHLDHALEHGYDHTRGGLYHRGVGDQPATDTDKIWWAQAEMMAALTDALAHHDDPVYRSALESLITFVLQYQVDPRDGIWLDTVTANGRPKAPRKAHNWKANYHDIRAIVKFVEAFGPAGW